MITRRLNMMMGIRAAPEPILQQGAVLVSQSGEHNHYLYQQTVFLYEFTQRGSRGVILERPTAFSMGEISPGIGIFEGNTLFMGGDQGSDTAIMLHPYNVTQSGKYVGAGIFLGGLGEAREMIAAGNAVPKDFKFFFNGIEWAPGVLEKEVEQGRWDVVEVTPDLILRQGGATTLWAKARAAVDKLLQGGGDDVVLDADDDE